MPLADHLFPIVLTARDAARLIDPVLGGLKREKLAVLHLDGERRLLGLIQGELDAEAELALPFRTIVADALRFNSAGIVIGHNHPSGDPTPSAADVDATRRLAVLMGELGICLHDHLVIADRGTASFRALGLL